MGRPPSAGLVRPKNDSMARAGPWWPMAVLDLRVGLAGKPPPALYCPSVDRLGIEAHFPAASRDWPSCRDHVAGGLALEFVGVPGGRIGHVCCLSSLRCILDDLPSGMRVRNDDTGPRPAAPGGAAELVVRRNSGAGRCTGAHCGSCQNSRCDHSLSKVSQLYLFLTKRDIPDQMG